ncbi:hypothetical protein GQ457_11G020780 [Hibiscus cannabinus]
MCLLRYALSQPTDAFSSLLHLASRLLTSQAYIKVDQLGLLIIQLSDSRLKKDFSIFCCMTSSSYSNLLDLAYGGSPTLS